MVGAQDNGASTHEEDAGRLASNQRGHSGIGCGRIAAQQRAAKAGEPVRGLQPGRIIVATGERGWDSGADVDGPRRQPRKERGESKNLILGMTAAVVDHDAEPAFPKDAIEHVEVGLTAVKHAAAGDRGVETDAPGLEAKETRVRKPFPPHSQRGSVPDANVENIERFVPKRSEESLPGTQEIAASRRKLRAVPDASLVKAAAFAAGHIRQPEGADSGIEVWPVHPAVGQIAASVSTTAAAATLVPGSALTCSAFTRDGVLKILRLNTILAVLSAATLGSRQARRIGQDANRNQGASDKALDRIAPG